MNVNTFFKISKVDGLVNKPSDHLKMRQTTKSVRSEKIVFIGAASSGKTSLGNRFTHDRFSPNSEATIGAAFISKVINVEGNDIKMDIWDTGGSEKYRSLAPMYFRDARAAIIVFDVTSRQSYEEADEWIIVFREKGLSNALIFGAANKCDLINQRIINSEEVKDFMFSHQLNFIGETSALSGEGVLPLFQELGKQLLQLPSNSISEDIQIAELDNTIESRNNNKSCDC